MTERGVDIGSVLPLLQQIRAMNPVMQGIGLAGARLIVQESANPGGAVRVFVLSPEGRKLRGAGFSTRSGSQ